MTALGAAVDRPSHSRERAEGEHSMELTGREPRG